ncbi:uncharacterized protein KY384_003022 [Bacidia gigantensis]|uniref:uncharacterized protein n=1 Tax=Bacidia gigantensis TaxID=2732470 RepID=UPI001D051B4B|nr:uncharacterized protein KY384_003022 [Bacidia gigantensis]KAG8531393.1 hypothetical protein KY384_003022 [Bacidia gigantensis]
MYLKSNPGKSKSKQDKDAIAEGYTPGENVLPKIKKKRETAEEVEDRRMVEEARELSLRDVGLRNTGYERGVRHRAREAAREAQSRDVNRGGGPTDETARAREIEHQSSLRSIVSRSDLGDSEDMEEEILRQIMEDGILDGIDLHNLDVSQEEELSEKIADAYRRRHRSHRRPRSRDDRSVDQRPASQDHDPAAEQGRSRRQADSGISSDRSTQAAHPPVSRPHLLEAYPRSQGHQRRTSSENRSRTNPTPPSHSRTALDTQTQAARSATDLASRQHQSERSSSGRSEASHRPQQGSSPEVHQLSPQSREHSHQVSSSRSSQGRANSSPTVATAQMASTPATQSPSPNSTVHAVEQMRNRSADNAVESLVRLPQSQSDATSSSRQLQTYTEPFLDSNAKAETTIYVTSAVSLARVVSTGMVLATQQISDLNAKHRQVAILRISSSLTDCKARSISVLKTLPVRRRPPKRQRPIQHRAFNPAPSAPHVPPSRPPTTGNAVSVTKENGVIATHALTKIGALLKRGIITPENGPKGWRRCPNKGHRMMIVGFEDGVDGQRRVIVEGVIGGWALDESAITDFNTNTNTSADSGGNSGKAEPEWSWREGSEKRRAKTVHRHSASHASSSTNPTATNLEKVGGDKVFPPSGGVGLRVVALWSYWPQEGVEDELGFPKGAEIRECENINEDWFWGIYCRRKGLFPGGYGRVIGRVGM